MRAIGPRFFNSFLAAHLKAYLELRQNLGYTSFSNPYPARDFDRYVSFRNIYSVRELDEGLVVNWIYSVPCAPRTKNNKLRFARGFFRYLIRMGLAQDNPALRVHYLKARPYKPYIYTLHEIHQILEEAKKLEDADPLLGPTLAAMVLLIYACGLRVSEALNLKIEDVDFEENKLSLWRTKFHKERVVPFSSMMAQELESYLALRQETYPAASRQEPFFYYRARKCRYARVRQKFRTVLVRCGLATSEHGRGVPRIHDFRHTFAIHRLYKWHQEGQNILNKLPLLATYMGHTHYKHTQVYLAVIQALLREGDRRFRSAFEDIAHKSLTRALRRI